MDTQETRHILVIRSWFVRCYFIVGSLLAHGFFGVLWLFMVYGIGGCKKVILIGEIRVIVAVVNDLLLRYEVINDGA